MCSVGERRRVPVYSARGAGGAGAPVPPVQAVEGVGAVAPEPN